MASAWISLPIELWILIFQHLDLSERAALLQCNQYLHSRLEPLLYGSEIALNQAMHWACKKGSLQTIHLAVSYGASISTVNISTTRKNHRNSSGQENKIIRRMKVSTLHLATRSENLNTFATLVKMRAKIDEADDEQLKFFIRRIYAPENEPLLLAFLKFGHPDQVRKFLDAGLPIASIIQNGGSAGLITALLDNAGLECLERFYKNLSSCLAAAIMRNSISVFDMLIERSAGFFGKEEWSSTSHVPSHIPIFAAAFATAKYGDITMMQRCLEHGANINHWTFINGRHDQGSTPLLFYLRSLESSKYKTGLRPIDCLAYLLEGGAIVDVPDFDMISLGATIISPLEVLFEKFGPEKLCDPDFFDIVEYLVKKGAGRYNAKNVLLLHGRRSNGSVSAEASKNWRSFVEIYLRQLDIFKPLGMSNGYILGKILFEKRPRIGPYVQLGDLDYVTIECLLEAGADINALSYHERGTVLHAVCTYERYESECWCRPGEVYPVEQAKNMNLFFAFLVARGINLSLVMDGKTAIEMLLEDVDEVPKNGREYLYSLADILEGKKRVP